jgi:hypothetical protein
VGDTKLSGTVTVHGDKLARNATVELHNAAGDVLDQVQVDDLGTYTYHLIEGNWKLVVWDTHGHRGAADVHVGRGEDKRLDLDLDEPEGGHRRD